MIYDKHFQTNTNTVILLALTSIMLLTFPIAIVNAVPGDSSDDRCNKIDSSKTIGQVECCSYDINDGKMYCTTCDATNPPSNCSPRYEHIIYKEDPTDETDDSINSERGIVLEELSDSELDQAQPTESQESGTSQADDGLSSNAPGLGSTFSIQQENSDSDDERNNDTTS